MGAYWLLAYLSMMSVFSEGVKVSLVSSSTMDTYVTNMNIEGMNFPKRSFNQTETAIIVFSVSEMVSRDDLAFAWFFSGSKFSVKRIKTDDESRHGDAYTTEVFSKDSKTLKVTLHITDDALIPGNYTLVVSEVSSTALASGFLSSAPVLPIFPKPKRVLEGDTVRLVCQVKGYPKPSEVFWYFVPVAVSLIEDDGTLAEAMGNLAPLQMNESRYVLETTPNGAGNDTLRFIELLPSDNGLYACNTSNALGSDFTLILVNVKDRWAAFWPFLGIIIEVAVLVTAILLYERHQMRSRPPVNTPKPDPTTEVASPPTAKQQNPNPNNIVENDASVTDASHEQKVVNQSLQTEELRLRGTTAC